MGRARDIHSDQNEPENTTARCPLLVAVPDPEPEDFSSEIPLEKLVEPSTPTHLNTLGGEALTYAGTGAIIGGVVGFFLGLGLWMTLDNETMMTYATNETPHSTLGFFLMLVFATIFFSFAGALVGVGVPKFNPNPEQGPIKKWKAIFVRRGNKNEEFFIPDEMRPSH